MRILNVIINSLIISFFLIRQTIILQIKLIFFLHQLGKIFSFDYKKKWELLNKKLLYNQVPILKNPQFFFFFRN